MSAEQEEATSIDRWTRQRFQIVDESTDAFLIRNGFMAATYRGFVKRMNMALEWIEPQVIPATRSIIDEIKIIVDDLDHRSSFKQDVGPRSAYPILSGQPRRPVPIRMPLLPNEADDIRCEKAYNLFEQAKVIHRLQPASDAQEKYKRKQKERASKPRKFTEEQYERIAKRYWAAKASGTSYGFTAILANEYDVTEQAIRNIAKRYKPDSIAK